MIVGSERPGTRVSEIVVFFFAGDIVPSAKGPRQENASGGADAKQAKRSIAQQHRAISDWTPKVPV